MRTQRINISFPKNVADELSSLVPPGKRIRLVVEATKKELHRLKMHKILGKTAGSWTDSNHPDLKTIQDASAWVENLRRSDENRPFHKGTGK